MEVFEFEKCLLTRLEEAQEVLQSRNQSIPASQVRTEWSCYIEVQIEPAGWQAMWKIPRVICEELDVKFPTVVFGYVEQIMFKELKAVFTILAVEDDDISLPERHEVALEELWPSRKQENSALNIETTADCVDKLRFFYNNIWMPWDNDNDDDGDWAEKHLDTRIRLYYDVKRKDMSRGLSAHIRSLLAEARYIQKRREYLELGLSDDEDLEDSNLDKSQITDLMRMHLRLTKIKSEIEMLENPEIRKLYDEIKFSGDKCNKDIEFKSGQNCSTDEIAQIFIVSNPTTIEKQMKYLKKVESIVSKCDKIVQMSRTLQDALNNCKPNAGIYLAPGNHFIKFLEYLNENGVIFGLSDMSVSSPEDYGKDVDANKEAVITTAGDDCCLLVFDGGFQLENVTLDCRYVRSGITIKSGIVHMKNCRIIGNGKSSTDQGILVTGNSELKLDSCLIQNFASGLVLHNQSKATLQSSFINGCRIGIELEDDTKIDFRGLNVISDFQNYGVLLETKCLYNDIDKKTLVGKDLYDLKENFCEGLPWTGDVLFKKGNVGQNVVVFNKFVSRFLFADEENMETDSTKNVSTPSSSDVEKDDQICSSSLNGNDYSIIYVEESSIESD